LELAGQQEEGARVSTRAVLPRLALLAAAALFSTGGAAIKATALTSWQVACLRSGVAALVLGVWLALRRESLPRLSAAVWLVGAVHGATMVLFVAANKLTTAASAIFLQSTAPLYLLLLSPWLLGERVRRRDLVYMLVLGVGLASFFVGLEPPTATSPDPLPGNLLGAVAGLTWALTVIGLRWLGSRSRGGGEAAAGADVAAVLCGNLLASLATLPWALPVAAEPRDWLVVLYLGAFQIALAYVFLTAGTRRVPALEASLLLLLEPVLSSVWAWWFHGEMPGPWSLAGGALIVVSTAVKTWLDARR
jgi:drug/metabolite transporter (DMT)-like permease